MDSSPSRKPVPNAKEIFEGQILLSKHMLAYLDTMFLKWCVELDIPNIIHKHGKPITLHELVSILRVPPPKIGGVGRLMRYLARNGIFEILRIYGKKEEESDDEEAYGLNVASELLVRSNFPCLAPMVESALHQDITSHFNHLSKWSCKEGALFKINTGLDIWEFMNDDSARFSRFHEAMASDSQLIHLALRDYGSVFEGLESIVDVGGGTGTLAKIINNMIPHLKCIVFDRPEVVDNLTQSNNNNVSYVSGNMFQFIPKAHAVVLKWVLHDWSDEECILILKKCKEAISSNDTEGKIIIIDMVINEKLDSQEIVQMKLKTDILLTTSMNGRERNEEEWKKLFFDSGFKDYKISPLTGLLSIIEVYL